MLVSFTASVFILLTYGHRVISAADDQYVQLSEIAFKGTLESGAAGLMPVDVFPVLKHFPSWLPGMGFKRRAASVRKDVQVMRDTLFEMAKEKMASLSTTPN